MNRPLEFLPDDYCSNCNTEHGLELYDVNGNNMNYNNILNEDNKEVLSQKYSIGSYFKCKKCGVVYPIEWRGFDWMPVPMKFVGSEDYLKIIMGDKRI